MKIAMDHEGIACRAAGSRCRPRDRAGDRPHRRTEIGCMLAVSFHATTDEVRDRLVPINKRWNIAALARRAARLSEGCRIPNASPSNT
jgi:23S rRNA (adenine2503-C2)-methyltransferase